MFSALGVLLSPHEGAVWTGQGARGPGDFPTNEGWELVDKFPASSPWGCISEGVPIVPQRPSHPWEQPAHLHTLFWLPSLCHITLTLVSWDHLPNKLLVPGGKQNLTPENASLWHEDYFIFKK